MADDPIRDIPTFSPAYQEAYAGIRSLQSGTGSDIRRDFIGLVVASYEALLDPRDSRDDPDTLREAARRTLATLPADLEVSGPWWSGALHPAVAFELFLDRIPRLQQDVDEVLRTILVWDALDAVDADLPTRRAALDVLHFACVAVDLDWLRTRVVRSGGRAFGSSFLRDVALAAAIENSGSPRRAECALTAMDELAAWSATTDPAMTDRIPGRTIEPRATRARRALVELAGVAGLTPWALARMPFHRLDEEDRRVLTDLMQLRTEMYPDGWVDEADAWATRAVELSLLQALDAAGTVAHGPGQGS